MSLSRVSRLRPGERRAQARVLLIHGLGRTARSMASLARFLDAQGFEAWALGYPSRGADAAALCERHVLPALRELQRDGAAVHVVGHSLGCILTRMAFAQEPPPEGTRFVMLAPPNAGSPIVDRLSSFAPIRWFLGPAGLQLGSGADALPASLPPLPDHVPRLVVAGARSGDPWFNFLFADGEHDGKVAVSSAFLPPPAQCLSVRATHTFVMNHPQAREALVRFLSPRD